MSIKILFVTHKPKQCGVYEFGKNVFNDISRSKAYHFIKVECDSIYSLYNEISTHEPDVIIYNYHPSVMPWVVTKISKGIYRNNLVKIHAVQIGIIHEITQEVADNATGYRNKFILGASHKKINSPFDFYIAADPTLLLKNPLVFKTGRLIPEYNNTFPLPLIPTIGSFGFGTPNKGFEKLVFKVQQEFKEAVVRLNIPHADFGDSEGLNAKRIVDNCRKLITNQNIKLEISHEFLQDAELLDFLAKNSMNVFMYEDKGGRGLSSALDIALAVNRPVAVSNCSMFRHLLNECPFVNADEYSFKEILTHELDDVNNISKDWNKANLQWEYERILKAIFSKVTNPVIEKKGIIKTIQSKWNKIFSIPDATFTWIRDTSIASEENLRRDTNFVYEPVGLNGDGYNRILDDKARLLYKPTIETLHKLAPATIAKKIERANVQQAFVFDTVLRIVCEYDHPKLLCIGSYEDTASMGLQKTGQNVENIDPMINYFLQEFFTKPSTIKNSYDIIFSTSVIEHDPDDKLFIECVENLLSPGGQAIITCDYKDGWKPGNAKPDVDARFYTKYDLEKRLPSYLMNSHLVDKPMWDCPSPDFNYMGKYQYTFATFVFRKNK